MMQKTKLLRVAIEATIRAERLDPRGEHFASEEPYTEHAEAAEAADRAWEEYDTHVWAQTH